MTHAWFEPDTFTGKIRCRLTFLTPVVIPGEQNRVNEDEPGYICSYLNQERLAIPGSRLRGYLFNLMRTINSSPLVHFQNQEILKRRRTNPKKGFIIQKANGQLAIQEVEDEVLVIHPDRVGVGLGLQNNCIPESRAVSYHSLGNEIPIPDYSSTNMSKVTKTDIFWQNPRWGPTRIQSKKKYLAQKNADTSIRQPGRWVKFAAWSGQDGANRLPDINGKEMAHRNQWHLANLDKCSKDHELTPATTANFAAGVEAMAQRLEEGEAYADLAPKVRRMKDLAPGTFVYFVLGRDNKTVVSMGRHYHYLVRLGTVDDKVNKACGLAPGTEPDPCLVQQLAGWASGREGGQKSRLWVEMALTPQIANVEICEKNLRILSSQPPQAHNFYLRGGDYDHENSHIRGRKFYWHDPLWGDKMWDNQDLGQGDHAFENPQPGEKKLWKQWSQAQVIWATPEQPVTFEFDLRVLNLTRDELYLLATALVGFHPAILADGSLGQSDRESWCHKIGHARPFLGSGYICITQAEAFDFDEQTWKPYLKPVSIDQWFPQWQPLSEWQQAFLQEEDHSKCLQRVMRFGGAYENLKAEEQGARISYPLGQENVNVLTWKKPEDKYWPKTYHWFSRKGSATLPLLPEPNPGVSQALPVYINPPRTR